MANSRSWPQPLNVRLVIGPIPHLKDRWLLAYSVTDTFGRSARWRKLFQTTRRNMFRHVYSQLVSSKSKALLVRIRLTPVSLWLAPRRTQSSVAESNRLRQEDPD